MRRFLPWAIAALVLTLTVQGDALNPLPFLGLLPTDELNAEQKEALDLLLEEYGSTTRRMDRRHGAMIQAFRRAAVTGEPDVDQQMATLIRMEAERLVPEARLGERIRRILTPEQLEQIVLLQPNLITSERASMRRAPHPDTESGHLVF